MAKNYDQNAINSMKSSNPSMFPTDEDAINWGKRYYGWTDEDPSGGGAPPIAAPAGTEVYTGAQPIGPMTDTGGTATETGAPSPFHRAPGSTTRADNNAPQTPPGYEPQGNGNPADGGIDRGPQVWNDNPPASGGAPQISWDPTGTRTSIDPNGTTTIIPGTENMPSPFGPDVPVVPYAPPDNPITFGDAGGVPKPIDPGGGGGTPKDDNNILRDLLIKQMTQEEVPNVNDAAIRAQLDPYRAEQERMLRGEIRSGAESAFAGGQDYGAPERVAAASQAGHNVGMMAGDLVGRELQARRQQISDAMSQFGSKLSGDQARALQEKLAMIDNALKSRGLDITQQGQNADIGLRGRSLDLQTLLGLRSADTADQELALKRYLGDKDFDLSKLDLDLRNRGLEQTGQLGNRELDVREKLGMGGLNSDLIRALLQNLQFNKRLGFDVGSKEADLNNNRALYAAGLGG